MKSPRKLKVQCNLSSLIHHFINATKQWNDHDGSFILDNKISRPWVFFYKSRIIFLWHFPFFFDYLPLLGQWSRTWGLGGGVAVVYDANRTQDYKLIYDPVMLSNNTHHQTINDHEEKGGWDWGSICNFHLFLKLSIIGEPWRSEKW